MTDESRANEWDRKILRAFKKIDPSGVLAWAILDQKAERFVTSALAASLNSSRRIALVEHRRFDLAIIRKWDPEGQAETLALYQAKCMYLSDLRPADKDLRNTTRVRRTKRPSKDRAWWFGYNLAWQLQQKPDSWAEKLHRGGLFYLFEVQDPRQQSKYGRRNPPVERDDAFHVLERCYGKETVGRAASKFARGVSGTAVRLHLALFGL